MTRSQRSMSSPGVRCRLRLILGMRLLERLALDPMAAGSPVPSIRSIAGASGAHRNTVAAVISDLAGFGLLRCAMGSGCTISRPSSAHDAGLPLFCAEPELAGRLTVELGKPVFVQASPPAASLFLQPLDLPPLPEVHCIPLAPCGSTLSVLRMLPPGSMAAIVSRSPAIRRLMANSIGAIHDRRVSILTLRQDDLDSLLIRSPLGGPPTTAFHDPDTPIDTSLAAATPLLILPPKAVDTG